MIKGRKEEKSAFSPRVKISAIGAADRKQLYVIPKFTTIKIKVKK